jgi:hypothetical protein
MEVIKWNKSKKQFSTPGFMVRVSPEEAMAIINSLSGQIMKGNANNGRIEFNTEKGEYFSIAVQKKVPTIKEKELEIDYIYNKIQRQAKYNATEWPLDPGPDFLPVE